MRAIAAASNLANGTGSAVDAAKVLRVRPDLVDGTLAPNSQLVKDARGLAKLSEDAFGMVVNDVVPERYAARVGDAFPDPEMQSVALRAIAKIEPANMDEAAILIERIKVAAVERADNQAQGSFFDGLFNEAESTVGEEMKIVARALRRLRTDATLFRGAVKKADRLEEAGSTIKRGASQAAADEASRAAFIAEKAFDTAGDIRGSLTDLARKVKRGETTLAQASNEFAAAVKNSQGATPGDSQPAMPQTVGTPPARGLVVANRAKDGTIYIGEPGDLHFSLSQRHGAEVRERNGLKPGDPTFDETGFMNPDGQYLSREEALAWVQKNERPSLREEENMEGEGLDADQYRNAVPESRKVGPSDPSMQAANDDQMSMFGAGQIAALAVRLPGAARAQELPANQFRAGLVEVEQDPSAIQIAGRQLIARNTQNRTVDELVDTIGPANQKALSDAAKVIADELGIELSDPGSKKNKARILEKIETKGYVSTAQVTDVARLGFTVNNPFEAAAIAHKLAESFLVLDEGWKITPAGYFDRKMMVQFADGMVGEVQIWSPKMIEAKSKLGGHQLYEEQRSLRRGDPGSEARYLELEEAQKRLYSAAIAAEGPRWQRTYDEALASSGNGGAPNLAKDASETRAPLSATSQGATSDQPAPGSRTAQARPPEITAGRPSQATNLSEDFSAISLDEYRARSPSQQDTQTAAAAFGEASNPQALVSGLRGQQVRDASGTPDLRMADQRGEPIEVSNLREMREKLAEVMELPAVREGRLSARAGRGQQVAGQYDRRTGVARLREIDDVEALAHEAAHHIETKWVNDLRPMVAVNAHARELQALDYDPYRGNLSEGFAEFFRLYVTNPQYAQQQAPKFYAAFDTYLRDKRAATATGIDDVRAAFNTYITAPSGAVVEAGLMTSMEPGRLKMAWRQIKSGRFDELRKSIAVTMSDWYTASIDEKNPIYNAVRQLAAIHKANTGNVIKLKAADDPYKLARLATESYNAGHMDLMHGIHPFREVTPQGPSLREAIVIATGQANAFGRWDADGLSKFNAYLVSRRAIFEYGRFERGEIPHVPTAETKGDHEVNIAELDAQYPQFAQAASMVHEWTRNLLKKKLDSGLISQTQYDQALTITDYVPFMRNMSDEEPTGDGPSRNLRQNIMQRFRGSSRPIIPPLESLMKQAYDTNILISQNEVVKSLDRLALAAGNGGGAIAERVPNTQMRRQFVDPIEALRNAAREQGIDEVDADAMIKGVSDLLGDDARASVFRLGEITEGGEPIVFFWEGGQRKALRLADGEFGANMFQVLTGMPQHLRDQWVNMVAAPSAVLRAGITTSPDFLIANYLRDQMSAWILTDGYVPFWSGARGMADEVAQRDIGRIYSLVGGISGGANVAALRDARIEHDLNALSRTGWLSQKLPASTDSKGLFTSGVQGAASVAETSETGTRLGVFRASFNRAKKEGLDDFEAAQEAAFAARDLIDFGRHGARATVAMRIVPFMNAALQGLDKSNRTLFAPAAKHLTGRILTDQDQKELATSMKAWAKLSALALLSMGLRALYSDDPDYDEGTEYIRATHWVFKLPGNDKAIRIPKPFELAIPINLAERSYEYFFLKDPKAMTKFFKSIVEVTSPPNALGSPLIKVPYEVATNTNLGNISLWQLLSGGKDDTRPIVPQNLQGLEPWLQYTHRTSMISKWMGEQINVSPAVIDHVVFGFTGSWGRGVTALTDQFSPKKGERGWEDTFITRRFMWNVSRGSASSQQFWQEVGKQTGDLEKKALSYKSMIDQGRFAEAADHISRLTDDQRAYVSLNRSNFDADTKRLHPLRRARDAMEVISAMRREIAFQNLKEATSGDKIDVSRTQQRMLDDALSHVAMLESRNALVTVGQKGWEQRPIIDAKASYDVIESISPKAAAELRQRYANQKVYTFEAVRSAWPETKKRLVADGGDADLSDLRADIKGDGYEFGETRQKKAKQLYNVPGRAGVNR